MKYISVIGLAVCLAQNNSQGVARRKYYKHKYHHLHHNPYFYYLAFLVIKMKFAFVIGTMIMVAMFASKSYALLRYGILNQKKEPEKVYVQAAEHYPSYSIAGDDHHDYSGHYGRSYTESIANNLDLIESFMQKLDLNDLTLDDMGIKDEECRKRFVCEANLRARNDTLIALEMILIRDENFEKYESNEPIKTLEDCTKFCK